MKKLTTGKIWQFAAGQFGWAMLSEPHRAEPALSRKRAVVIPQFKGNYADGRRGKKGLQHDKQKDGPQKCGAVRLYL